MPELVRLYIRNVLFGAALSAAFVGMLLWFNIANLWHLVSHSDVGYIAVGLLFVFNAIVFAGVQFGISVMRMAEDDTPPGGGKRDAVAVAPEMIAIPIPVESRTAQRRIRR